MLRHRRRIPDVFESQARKTPDAIAVSFGEQTLTYRELNDKADALARFLRSLGVGPEVPVALYLDRSPLMVIAILGVLKAGGMYVPMDLAYPADRVAFMLEDSRALLLLSESGLRSSWPSTKARVVALDAAWADIEACPEVPQAARLSPDNAAYIIYTSGSTGQPKGVVVTHQNVVRLLEQTAHWYGFHSGDVWPLFHSYAFDVSVWELWGCLFNGGRLVVVPYLVTRSPRDFYELLSREQVTVLNQTPSAFRQLIWAEVSAGEPLPLCLRYVICAGEALELQSLKPWFDRHGDDQPRVVNMYGITETTVHTTFRVIRQDDLRSGVGSVIGIPIPDLQLYLVDDDLKPVGRDTPGEICVGGAGVARGYLNRPELNAKRFLPDPFSAEPGARMYRSGDLAQYNAHGELEYLGRMDHQVKIRGFRVELGEIESALNRHPGIRESVVLARDSALGDKRVVAYCVPVSEPPNVSELREKLGAVLPSYMIPAAFVFLEELPLTTNGKVDRKALPPPGGERPALKNACVAPRTPQEETLAGIWSRVLGIDGIGVEDSYFELGGDSIRAISILAAARNAGLGISLEQLFRHPTIAELARLAVSPQPGEACPSTAPFSLISPEDRARLPQDAVDAYPIGKLQLGMFYRNELTPASAAYHDVFTYRVSGDFRSDLLEPVLNRLLGRHPVLRSSFHLAGFSEPLQIVHREVAAPFSVEDLGAMDAAVQERAICEYIEAEKHRPFQRTSPPMIRFHVQVLSPRAFQFVVSFHHSCVDGWSLAAIVDEIFRDYSAALEGRPGGIEPPSAAYRDFIALERLAAASEGTRQFWSRRLEGAALRLLPRWPQGHCSGGLQQLRGPECMVPVPVLDGLRRLARESGVPLKTVLLAAHQRVLSFLHAEDDVTTGLISNGRPEVADGERIIGLFLNAVPFRLQLGGGSWRDLVRQVFNAEQELLPHRRLPLAEAQKLAGGTPLFETAFDFVHFHVLKNLQDGAVLDVRESHYFEANDLTTYTTFMLDAAGTSLELHIDYDPNQIARQQVEQFTAWYLAVLEAMAGDPSSRYEAFLPFAPAERQELLSAWNDSAEPYPETALIHQLFEDRVAHAPEAPAVVCGSVALSFAELDAHADILAERLRGLGAGNGKLVGICLERSVEMVIGLLGILKSGAAYVPLDPAYPSERLAFMIEDSGLDILLTSSSLPGVLPASNARTLCIDRETPLRTSNFGLRTSDSPSNLEPRTSSSLRSSNLEPRTSSSLRSSNFEPRTSPPLRTSNFDLRTSYIIYTSGSTGRPKGVQVTHRSVINLLCSAARKLRVTPADTVLAVTTLSFDIAALELFLPLITGARLVIAPRETTCDATSLAALIETSSATLMQATPATWRLLIESGWTGRKDLRILCGGEPLKPALARDLLSRAGEVWNFYGPTETTIWSTAWKVAPDEPILIGRPLANTRLYIVDRHLRPVPVGAVGELLIGGHGVACGYLNRPELTSEKFIPDPVDPGAGLVYRTGDLAKYLPDGQVQCLGRLDHQVKIRGFRIEPGEIETALRQCPGIAEAVVAARDDSFGEKRLIAYLISRNGPPSTTDLRELLKRRLPLHMVPSQFVLLRELPLTPNGKVDHHRLPGPDAAARPARAPVPPRDEIEQTVADIWREVLGIPSLGVEDDFFELGGDSLAATRVFARINRAFSMEISLREILDHPTITLLSPLIRRARGTAVAPRQTIPRQPRPYQNRS